MARFLYYIHLLIFGFKNLIFIYATRKFLNNYNVWKYRFDSIQQTQLEIRKTGLKSMNYNSTFFTTLSTGTPNIVIYQLAETGRVS